MKEEIRTYLDKINIIEIEIFANSLELDTKIMNTTKLKSKATLIAEIADYIVENELLSEFYNFCSNGVMLFYPMNINKDKTLFDREGKKGLTDALKKLYEIKKLDNTGTIYLPKGYKKLFSELSIFISNKEDSIIFFKKYANNKLSLTKRAITKIETLFKIKIDDNLKSDLYYRLFNEMKSRLNYKINLPKGYISTDYVSHKFKNNTITISSKLSYVTPATKEVYTDDPTTSEAISKRMKDRNIPDEVNYAVNIPNSSRETIEFCGINLHLNSNNRTTRYAINMRKKEF